MVAGAGIDGATATFEEAATGFEDDLAATAGLIGFDATLSALGNASFRDADAAGG